MDKHLVDLNLSNMLPPGHPDLKKVDYKRMNLLSFLDKILFRNNTSISSLKWKDASSTNIVISNANPTVAKSASTFDKEIVYCDVWNDETFFYTEIKSMFTRIDAHKRQDCFLAISKMLEMYK